MEQQDVIDKLRRGELMLMEYLWRKKSILSKKEIIEAMKKRYKWRKSTTEILLGRLVKMRILKKKRAGFQLNYEVLVTKKEYLNVIKEEKDVSKYDNFFTQVFTTIHKKEEKTEEQIKVFIESMQKLGKK
ncbi:TPA: BlaI/MecI/CopY family transcriptional regulator [Clostridioides difficile]|uniref:BlaI/MecI/CopY family transcriptional regulator n=1 Tax=Clostridioides difficile TaxID=1496 RepID=UPI000980112D|nr:BlaI/MecI/CopY family transcriptional regulator [Clostridioides difficile]SJR51261.1 copper transport repressor, CopY/TcrY family [Clostridioides difficile]SJW46943.1 regulatory protein [Clostridioides difficile]SJW96628.1 regulatory protein [Clostridioides difficile]HBF0729693.1 BlaI/MecI/CopY family transcriptional regulator [Clostridioides difficile]HBF0937557.1 BlaI/MecI/CopY family transcriptional regulator [Clostridioides difficile]